MSVKLIDQIKLLTTPAQFNALLIRTESVSISWGGQRLLNVLGFQDKVEINVLARQFLDAAPLLTPLRSLRDRLAWYELWNEMEFLYRKSQIAWEKTWVSQRFSSTGDQDSRAMIEENNKVKEIFLTFSLEEFTRLWPRRANKMHRELDLELSLTKEKYKKLALQLIVSVDMVQEAMDRGHA